MTLEDNSSSNPQDIACVYDNECVYQDPIVYDIENFNYIHTQDEFTSNFQLNLNDILNIDDLDSNKGPGPDQIHPKFVKRLKDSLSNHLLFIFNESLKQGIFPNVWKYSYIIPIFKSGDKQLITNYRGIAIQSVFPKLFEKIVTGKLSDKLRKFINPNQHRFDSGKSTTNNLVQFTPFLRREMSSGARIDTIYTDVSKAFDKVHHSLLVAKLHKYGIRGPLLLWLESYLTKRKQTFKFVNTFSRDIDVTSSVPQGSHLGPLLFLVFINDLTILLRDCKFSLYADDLKIFKVIKSHDDVQILQGCLSIIHLWCLKKGMSLNVSKCNVMTFSKKRSFVEHHYSIDNKKLEQVSCVRDLGVILDKSLTFDFHIDKICNSGNSILGFIKRRAKEFCDISLTKLLYCSLVDLNWNMLV